MCVVRGLFAEAPDDHLSSASHKVPVFAAQDLRSSVDDLRLLDP